MKKIRLLESKDKRYTGRYFSYHITYDYGSGKSNRYNVWAQDFADDNLVIIGRELKLNWIRNLILDYEICAKKYMETHNKCGHPINIFYIKEQVIIEKLKRSV